MLSVRDPDPQAVRRGGAPLRSVRRRAAAPPSPSARRRADAVVAEPRRYVAADAAPRGAAAGARAAALVRAFDTVDEQLADVADDLAGAVLPTLVPLWDACPPQHGAPPQAVPRRGPAQDLLVGWFS